MTHRLHHSAVAVAILSMAWSAGCGQAPVLPGSPDGGGDADPTPVADPVLTNLGTWARVAEGTAGGPFADLWVFASDDVLLVGGGEGGGSIARFDGSGVQPVTIPETGTLNAVVGFSDGSAVAVGAAGSVLSFDGTTWTARASASTANFFGVWGAQPDEVWIVGRDGGTPAIVRFNSTADDASAFAPFPMPNFDRNADALFDVFGAGQRLFAVGAGGLILEFDRGGGAWRQSPTGPAANEDFLAISGTSESNMVAVGGETSGRISVYDGRRWVTQLVSVSGPLRAVRALQPDLYVVAGDNGFVAAYNPLTNSFRVESSGQADPITALDATAEQAILAAVGSTGAANGAILTRVVTGTPPPDTTPPDTTPPDTTPPDTTPPDTTPPGGPTLVVGVTNNGIFDDLEDGNILRIRESADGTPTTLITLRTTEFNPTATVMVAGDAVRLDDGTVIAQSIERGTVTLTEIQPGVGQVRDFEFLFDVPDLASIENVDAVLTVTITDVDNPADSATFSVNVFLAPPRSR